MEFILVPLMLEYNIKSYQIQQYQLKHCNLYREDFMFNYILSEMIFMI